MADDGLIALAGLHPLVLPVQIVELDLDELHLRVGGQDLVQEVRLVMEGEAQVANLPRRLLLLEVGEGVQPLGRLIAGLVDVVEQVVIKVLHPAFLQLLVEDRVLVGLGAAVLEAHEGHLRRQGEAVPAMALHQSLPGRDLALPGVVHVRGVEIGISPLQEGVHHLADLLHVHRSLLLGVRKGQAHHAKAQFFHVVPPQI